jgi:hypothetical protein
MFVCFFWCILSCTVPLPRAVRPPAVPFKVVFYIGVGWCIQSSMYGVTQHDAPESIMACDVSFVHAFVAISTDFFVDCLVVSHLGHQIPRYIDIDVEFWVM